VAGSEKRKYKLRDVIKTLVEIEAFWESGH
jgi:hypothetical protein